MKRLNKTDTALIRLCIMMSINISVWATNTQDGEPLGEVQPQLFYDVLSNLKLGLRDRVVFGAVSEQAKAIAGNDLENTARKAAKCEVQAIIDMKEPQEKREKQIADVLIKYGVGLNGITIEPTMRDTVQKELEARFIEAIKAQRDQEPTDKKKTNAVIASALKADVCIDSRNQYGMAFLRGAAARGDLDVVQHLIDWGACVNARDRRGLTPLGYAVVSNHPQVVTLLVEQGAKVDLCNHNGLTPLYLAVCNNYLVVVERLIKHGADVNARNRVGQTPLHFAAMFGYLDIVKCLVKHRADVNAQDAFRTSLLYYAQRYGHTQVEEFLICQGAQSNTSG